MIIHRRSAYKIRANNSALKNDNSQTGDLDPLIEIGHGYKQLSRGFEFDNQVQHRDLKFDTKSLFDDALKY